MTNTSGITRIEIIVILVIAILLVFILYPAMQHHGSSAIDADSASDLKLVGIALRDYSAEHRGSLPESLHVLYPQYFHDRKILTPIFDYVGVKVAITYWHPKRLGDAKTPVAEVTPVPRRDKESHLHSYVLWGDLRVERRK